MVLLFPRTKGLTDVTDKSLSVCRCRLALMFLYSTWKYLLGFLTETRSFQVVLTSEGLISKEVKAEEDSTLNSGIMVAGKRKKMMNKDEGIAVSVNMLPARIRFPHLGG